MRSCTLVPVIPSCSALILRVRETSSYYYSNKIIILCRLLFISSIRARKHVEGEGDRDPSCTWNTQCSDAHTRRVDPTDSRDNILNICHKVVESIKHLQNLEEPFTQVRIKRNAIRNWVCARRHFVHYIKLCLFSPLFLG